MQPDDDLCLCFHVTRRKVEQFLRTERPAVASQLSECYGAGTGCGWCRPFLQRLHEREMQTGLSDDALPSSSDYAAARANYRALRTSGSDEP